MFEFELCTDVEWIEPTKIDLQAFIHGTTKNLHSLTKVTAVTPKSKPQAKQKPKLVGKKPTKKAEAKEGSVVNKRGVRRSARNQVEGKHGEEV